MRLLSFQVGWLRWVSAVDDSRRMDVHRGLIPSAVLASSPPYQLQYSSPFNPSGWAPPELVSGARGWGKRINSKKGGCLRGRCAIDGTPHLLSCLSGWISSDENHLESWAMKIVSPVGWWNVACRSPRMFSRGTSLAKIGLELRAMFPRFRASWILPASGQQAGCRQERL